MTDVHDKATRSYNMSRIKSKNTKPEMIVRRFLFSCGFRYRLHVKDLPGKPDIVLPKHKIVVFVNGCFWHGHADCKYYSVPKTNTEWWLNKINRNKQLDARYITMLQALGWKVYTVFACELKKDIRHDTLELLLNEFH